jgi:anthraniloyl-CoA monooxygenase
MPRIVCVGGGPAGLYFSILTKLRDPQSEVVVHERNRADDTFGFGVVFSDKTLENLAELEPLSYQRITERLAHWDDIDVFHRGEVIRSGGHGFSGIARTTLLAILQDRAREVGVDVRSSVKPIWWSSATA